MKTKFLILTLILSIFLFQFVSATCTLTFDKGTYAPTETITADIVCTSATEKSDEYTLNWTNQSGYQFEADIGTTPATTGVHFYESYTIPSNWPSGVWVNATLIGTDLDGANDSANVSGASANTLLITNASVGGKYLGLTTSVQATVKDNAGKKISGGQCKFSAWSNDETQMLQSGTTQLFDGNLKFDWVLDYLSFTEGTDFAILLHCYCGSTGSSAECIDEDGGATTNSIGTAKVPFTTNMWLSVKENPLPITYSNGTSYSNPSLYAGFDTVYFRRNITNNQGTQLKAIKEMYIVNNATGQIYDTAKFSQSPVITGDSSTIFNYKIPQDIETGIYYIKIFADIYYNNILVVSKIMSTETFNVTSVQDTMTINSITIKDYWGNEVNTSSGVLSSSSMPTSNWTDPYTVLTEGFGYQICGNITNSYTSNIYWHMQNLILHNPTIGESYEEFNKNKGDTWQRVLPVGDTSICWIDHIPLAVTTHSDYHFNFDIYIGDEKEAFDCEENCGFSGETEYLYIGAIEDTIVFDKWLTKPTNSAQGVPGIFIVTEREEYLSMNDDCNYTDQESTDWGNASFLCNKKNGGGQLVLNLSEYPIAGEEFRVCFQTHNYFQDEIDLEFFDIYLDSDVGETSVFFQGEQTEGYVPSITDDKLYLSETPSRALELGGNLVDSYGIMCSKWLEIPPTLDGGNNWDVQGKVKINSDIYNLEEEIIWNWESDEFPIFGARLDENFVRLIDITNMGTSANQGNITACTDIIVNFTYDYLGNDEDTFIAQYCFEQTDRDNIENCYQEIINPDVGTGNVITDTFKLPYFETSGNAEVAITILGLGQQHDLNELLGYGDIEPQNTFTIIADNSDSCKYTTDTGEWFEYREAVALEGIENKTGTFHLDINCPAEGIIGTDMNCVITAYVEDSQTVEKEVDFTCYILDESTRYSSVNFNQMITKSTTFISQNFLVPSSFNSGKQYLLQCHADYYNLGSRRDSFYDSFTANINQGKAEGGGSSPITGGAIDEGEEREDEEDEEDEKDIEDIIDEFNPFSPDRNWAFMFIEAVILAGIFSYIFFFIRKRIKERHCHYHPHKFNFKDTMRKVFAGIIIILVIVSLAAGILYGYSFVRNSFVEKTVVEQTTIPAIEGTSQILLQGDLIKSIFLIFIAVLIISLIIIIFTTILVLIVSKLLNIRGEIKFGHNYSTRKFHEDKKYTKMQQKLNRMILKDEIKKQTTKEDYNVRKMTSNEFSEFIRKKINS